MEERKHKKPHKKSCRRNDVGNGGDFLRGKIKKGQEKVGSVATDSDNLENSKELRREAHDTQSFSRI